MGSLTSTWAAPGVAVLSAAALLGTSSALHAQVSVLCKQPLWWGCGQEPTGCSLGICKPLLLLDRRCLRSAGQHHASRDISPGGTAMAAASSAASFSRSASSSCCSRFRRRFLSSARRLQPKYKQLIAHVKLHPWVPPIKALTRCRRDNSENGCQPSQPLTGGSSSSSTRSQAESRGNPLLSGLRAAIAIGIAQSWQTQSGAATDGVSFACLLSTHRMRPRWKSMVNIATSQQPHNSICYGANIATSKQHLLHGHPMEVGQRRGNRQYTCWHRGVCARALPRCRWEPHSQPAPA